MYLAYLRDMSAVDVKARLLADLEAKCSDAMAKVFLGSDDSEKDYYRIETERLIVATMSIKDLNDSEVKELLIEIQEQKAIEAADFADEVEHKTAEEIKAAVDTLTVNGETPFFGELRFGMNQRLAVPQACTSLTAGTIKLDRKESDSVLLKKWGKEELDLEENDPVMDRAYLSRAHYNMAKKIIEETHSKVAYNDAELIEKYQQEAASDGYPWAWDEEVEQLVGNWRRGEVVRGMPPGKEDQVEGVEETGGEVEGMEEEVREEVEEGEAPRRRRRGLFRRLFSRHKM